MTQPDSTFLGTKMKRKAEVIILDDDLEDGKDATGMLYSLFNLTPLHSFLLSKICSLSHIPNANHVETSALADSDAELFFLQIMRKSSRFTC
jgi:hypothetical protein